MGEEAKQTTPPVDTQAETNAEYIEALKQMRENTVSKSDYDKLKEDNKKLLQALINGENIDIPTASQDKTINDLRKSLLDSDSPLSNLEFAQKTIELRDRLLEAGEKDPFLPYGHKVRPTEADKECANRVAQCLKDCIEYAEGDSGVFTSELQRLMIDTAPPHVTARLNKQRRR